MFASDGEKLAPLKLLELLPGTHNEAERFITGVDTREGKLVRGLRLGDEERELKGVVGVCGNGIGDGVRNMGQLRGSETGWFKWERCWFKVVLSTSLLPMLLHTFIPAQNHEESCQQKGDIMGQKVRNSRLKCFLWKIVHHF